MRKHTALTAAAAMLVTISGCTSAGSSAAGPTATATEPRRVIYHVETWAPNAAGISNKWEPTHGRLSMTTGRPPYTDTSERFPFPLVDEEGNKGRWEERMQTGMIAGVAAGLDGYGTVECWIVIMKTNGGATTLTTPKQHAEGFQPRVKCDATVV